MLIATASKSQNLTLRTIDNAEELNTVKDEWESIGFGNFECAYGFYHAFVEYHEPFIRPHICLVENKDDHNVEGMLLARLEKVDLPIRLGYKTLFTNHVNALTILHDGVIAETDEVARLLVSSLKTALKDSNVDVLIIPSLRADIPFGKAIFETFGTTQRERFSLNNIHHFSQLPSSQRDDWMLELKRKNRYNLRRVGSDIHKAFGDRIKVVELKNNEDLERIFEVACPLSAKTYHAKIGGFVDTKQHRAVIEYGLRQQQYRMYVAYIDDQPVAFQPGFVYHGTFFGLTPAYDPAFRKFGLGIYLIAYVMSEIAKDPSIDSWDFGKGEAIYKHKFSTTTWVETEMRIWSVKPRLIAVKFQREVVGFAASALKKVLARWDLEHRVKRIWRDQLAGAKK
jgi:hypothetical protein